MEMRGNITVWTQYFFCNTELRMRSPAHSGKSTAQFVYLVRDRTASTAAASRLQESLSEQHRMGRYEAAGRSLLKRVLAQPARQKALRRVVQATPRPDLPLPRLLPSVLDTLKLRGSVEDLQTLRGSFSAFLRPIFASKYLSPIHKFCTLLHRIGRDKKGQQQGGGAGELAQVRLHQKLEL